MATLKRLVLTAIALMAVGCLTGNQKEFLSTHDKAIVKDKDTYMYSVWIGKVQTFQKRYKLYLTSLDLRDTTIMDVSSGIYEKHEIGDTINTGILWQH